MLNRSYKVILLPIATLVFAAYQTENTLSLFLAYWFDLDFCSKVSKKLEHTWFLHSPNNILKLNQPPFPCCNSSFSLCFSSSSTMAKVGSSSHVRFWAGLPQGFINIKHKHHLFQGNHPKHHCITNFSKTSKIFDQPFSQNYAMPCVVPSLLSIMQLESH